MFNSPAHWSAVADQHTGMHDTPHARDTVRLHLTNAPLPLLSFFFSILKCESVDYENAGFDT